MCLAFVGLPILVLHLNNVPFWAVALVSVSCGLISAIIVHFIVKPYLVKWIRNKETPGFKLDAVGDSSVNKGAQEDTKKIPYYTQPKFEPSKFQKIFRRIKESETLKSLIMIEKFHVKSIRVSKIRKNFQTLEAIHSQVTALQSVKFV